MQTFNIKEVIKEMPEHWNNFKFEITFSKSGVTRIFINDRKTKYNAGGYGYDKISTVLSNMINDILGVQDYNSNIYGNRNGLLSYGVGFSSTKESFESLKDCKLNQIYSGLNSNIYEITFSIELLKK